MGRERCQISLLRLGWHKDCSLAVMVTAGSPGTPRWPAGAAGLAVVRTTALPRGAARELCWCGRCWHPCSCQSPAAPHGPPRQGSGSWRHIWCHFPASGHSPCRTERARGAGDKTPRSRGGETPGDSNLSIGRVKAIIFYLQRMAESLVVSGAQKQKEKVAMARGSRSLGKTEPLAGCWWALLRLVGGCVPFPPHPHTEGKSTGTFYTSIQC